MNDRVNFVVPWWKLLAARILGERITGYDHYTATEFVAYRWRGVLYAWSITP